MWYLPGHHIVWYYYICNKFIIFVKYFAVGREVQLRRRDREQVRDVVPARSVVCVCA